MRRSILYTCGLLLLGAAVPPAVRAQDAESEVRNDINHMLAAWRNGDLESFSSAYHGETRGFNIDGGPLIRGFNKPVLQAAWDAGFRADAKVRELDVKVFGDAAVSAAILDAVLNLPGGNQITGAWRYTETRVRENGEWKIVQYHFSKLGGQGLGG